MGKGNPNPSRRLRATRNVLLICACFWQSAFAAPTVPPSLAGNQDLTDTLEYQRWSWAFSQRVSPRGRIPDSAKLKALNQIKQHEKLHQQTSSQAEILSMQTALQGDKWVSIGPAPLLSVQSAPVVALSGRVSD